MSRHTVGVAARHGEQVLLKSASAIVALVNVLGHSMKRSVRLSTWGEPADLSSGGGGGGSHRGVVYRIAAPWHFAVTSTSPSCCILHAWWIFLRCQNRQFSPLAVTQFTRWCYLSLNREISRELTGSVSRNLFARHWNSIDVFDIPTVYRLFIPGNRDDLSSRLIAFGVNAYHFTSYISQRRRESK